MSENLNLCSTRKEVADYLSVLEGEPYFYIIRDQINEKKDLEMSAYAEHVKMVLQDAAEHLIEQVNQEKSAPLHRERRAELKHKISLKYMATLERLEAMIDRQFKRLAHLKGYKEMIAFLQAPQIKTTPEASIR